MRNTAILLLVLALASDLAVEALLSGEYRKEQKLEVLEQASLIRARLEGTLSANFHLARGMASVISLNPGISQQAFNALAAKILATDNQLRNIAAAPDLVIRYIYPLAGNEQALGLDYTRAPAQREAALQARDSGHTIVAGPVDLVQGGSGLVMRFPVFVDQPDAPAAFWGLLSAVLDADRLYRSAGLLDSPLTLALRGKDGRGGEGAVFFGAPELFDEQAVQLEVVLPHGSWVLAARPPGGWQRLPGMVWVVRGVILGVLMLSLWLLWQRHCQQRARELRNAKFSATFNESPLGMAISGLPSTRLVEVNDAFTLLAGIGREAALERPLAELLRVDQHAGLLAEAQPTGHLQGVELKSWDAAGEPRYWRYFASRFDTPEGPHLLSLIQDITHQKEVDRQLELAQQVIDNTSDGVLIADQGARIISINPAFTQITGYSRQEAVGQTPRLFKSGRHDAAFYEAMWHEIVARGRWSGEVWNRRKSGDVFPTWLSINRIDQEEGVASHYIAVLSDISKIKQAERELTQLAYYDPLTALPNRSLFRDRLAQEIASARRHNYRFALMFIDLDRFKDVNDSLGHNIGDQLLHEVACRLARLIRESDTAARLGGDEFTLILSEVERLESVNTLVERLLTTLQAPIRLEGQDLRVGASIGIVLFPDDGDSCESLIQHADMAMYQAKANGGNRFHYYTHSLQEQVLHRITLERELREAVETGQFTLYYQPKLDLHTGVMVGTEALVRWIHPQRGLVPPLDFIPLAEETGLILPLGRWILEEACRQTQAWRQQGLPNLQVAVNLSSRQFADRELLVQVGEVLNATGLNAGALELELTESMLMEDTELAVATMHSLRTLGVQLSIDDFGTGYSSLAYLKRFPLHHLKIDQSFVRDLTIDSEDAAIIRAIIYMSKGLGLTVIAEGIETRLQMDFLLAQECSLGQGYLFSPPLPAEALLPWLEGWQRQVEGPGSDDPI